MSEEKMIIVEADKLRAQLRSIFLSWGMSEEASETSLEIMVGTDLKAIDSHGVGMLSAYSGANKMGMLNVSPDIKIVSEKAALALVDGDGAMGHVAGSFGMELAIKKAREAGTGAVTVMNSGHYGPAGHYSEMAAKEGMIGWAMTNSPRLVVPTFGKEPMLGTNPIAVAAPADKDDDFSLDIATSTVAYGKLNIARRAGKEVPVGWAQDTEGNPVTDPLLGMQSRRLSPLGGTREQGSHKGYGLGIVVEIMCSLLSGASTSGIDIRTGEPTGARNTGHFFLAIDPAALRGEGVFQEEMDLFMAMYRKTDPIDPDNPVIIPGDPEHAARRERTANGIPMTDTLFGEIRQVAEDSEVPFILGN